MSDMKGIDDYYSYDKWEDEQDEREYFNAIGGEPSFAFDGVYTRIRLEYETVHLDVWFDYDLLGIEDGGEYEFKFQFQRLYFEQNHAAQMALIEAWAREFAASLSQPQN